MIRCNERTLFDRENDVLQAALEDLSDPKFEGNALLHRYANMVKQYQKLLRLTRKVFYISDSQGLALQHHQREIRTLLDHANQGFLMFGQDFKIHRQYSAECYKVFGRKIAGCSIIDLLAQDNCQLQDEIGSALGRIITGSKEEAELEIARFPRIFQIENKDVRVECKLILTSETAPENATVMMILTDITEQLKAEKKISFLSYHDKLTSLRNRAYVEDQFAGTIEAVPFSLIMVDVNGLKLVNDVFGHNQGDTLLIAMAEVLNHSCRQTDSIARWGGDEFVVLLPGADAEKCGKICVRIQEKCAAHKGCVIPLSIAVGMVCHETGSCSLEDLFNIAESRMYNDKTKKRREVQQHILNNLENMLISHCDDDQDHRARINALAHDFAVYIDGSISEKDAGIFSKLAKLHDIGKVAIPVELLGSTYLLSPDDWDIIKSHSEIGYRLAKSVGEYDVADAILALHERWDGQGYPYGIEGADIPYLARLFAIVDAYDTMTHDRAYKAAVDVEAALKEITSCAGTQFDPHLASKFMEYYKEKNRI